MENFLSEDEIAEICQNPIGKVIDFSKIPEIQFPRIDIVDCKITGVVDSHRHTFGKGNIVNCDIRDFASNAINFEYVDFKDSNVKKSSFKDCVFDFGAMINNVFKNCIFENDRFHNMSITDSTFANVRFVNCDLSNMVIKGCSFLDCEFIDSTTSNKLIEASSLFNCRFLNTDIQVHTITENFGININDLVNSKVRSNREREPYLYLTNENILSIIEMSTSSTIEKLTLTYFLDDKIFIDGATTIDEVFDIRNWISLFKIPSAFTNLFELFLDFIIYEYEQDNLPMFVILKYHDMTSRLIDHVTLNNELYKSIMGVHMTLSRFVEEFLSILYGQSNEIKEQNLSLKVIGPLDIEYYKRELNHFLLDEKIKIVEVKKANSPNILFFIWNHIEGVVLMLSLLFSTRLKIELSKYYPNKVSAQNYGDNFLLLSDTKESSSSKTRPEELQLFNMELGLSKVDEKHLFSIKFRSIMPGNLLTILRLDINTRFLGKLRGVLVDLIK